jgi:hypothetical protein
VVGGRRRGYRKHVRIHYRRDLRLNLRYRVFDIAGNDGQIAEVDNPQRNERLLQLLDGLRVRPQSA